MIKLVDFNYHHNAWFWEYYLHAKRNKVWGPTPQTVIKRVEIPNTKIRRCLADDCFYKDDPCIVIYMTPVKNLVWNVGLNNDQFRMRCYTTVQYDIPRLVQYESVFNQPGYFFIVQGDLTTIDFQTPNRVPYKKYKSENWVQEQLARPKPSYVTVHSDYWSLTNADSDTTVIAHNDGGWWFEYYSMIPWYSPYQLTWRKIGVNSISWRTPGENLFQFGFENNIKDTVEMHKSLIRKYLPKTKKLIYFGQCLGTNYALMCAYENDWTRSVYLTTPCFNVSQHKSSNLLEVTPDIDVDNLDAINYLNNLDRQGIESKFVFKMYDAQEQIQLNRWKQEIAPSYHKTTKTYTYHFEDVFAPVFAKDQDYNINSMIEGLDNFNINDITYTQEEMEDHDPTVLNKQKSEFKHL